MSGQQQRVTAVTLLSCTAAKVSKSICKNTAPVEYLSTYWPAPALPIGAAPALFVQLLDGFGVKNFKIEEIHTCLPARI